MPLRLGFCTGLRNETKLGGYGGVAGAPGFPFAVASVITELRLARVSQDQVAAVSPDLAHLVRAYESTTIPSAMVASERRVCLRAKGDPRS